MHFITVEGKKHKKRYDFDEDEESKEDEDGAVHDEDIFR